ncbi:GGDEF domain-containing protein [Amphibiibacter pelophylacis]|uniref:GGDEF domain-containing protein n=1 Tax=Amphibiibacter pelophylacis TaxID=1799477 RepID=A0ACC6NYQ2_9BURK
MFFDRNRAFIFPGFVLLVGLVLVIDYQTILLVPFTSVYMVVLYLASKKVDTIQVYVLAALCLAGTFLLDLFMIGPETQQVALLLSWRLLINALSFFGTAVMSTRLTEVHDRLIEQSDQDFLTQILNRRSFTRELDRDVSIHCRQRRPFAIAFFDVDNFKVINDTRGHKFGDRVLIEVARSLERHIRSMDRACRYGGDEFVVFLGEVDEDKAQCAIQRVRGQLYADVGSVYPDISLSIGVVVFALDRVVSAEELIAQADREMYTIKKRAKNDVSVVRFVPPQASQPKAA